MKAKWLIPCLLLFALIFAAALTACSRSGQKPKILYHCPMHPQIVSDKPGDCPICGMRLVPIESKGPAKDKAPKNASGPPPVPASTAVQTAPKKKIMYRSTMNPNEVSDHPGKDSMGMEMVPFEVKGGSGPSGPASPSGLATVNLTASAAERAGVTMGTAKIKPLFRDVRTSARITPDETRLFRVNTKVSGWVDRLYVNVTGQAVRKGQPLISIYSPELAATEQEYLSALESAGQLAKSPFPSVAGGGMDLVSAAKERLRLWDISEGQIERITKTGRAERDLVLYAPASGYVMEKNVLEGQKITAGEPLMVLADLSTVWADADIYETDLPYVKVGMPITFSLPYWPGEKFNGKIGFLDPYLDPKTRTLRARLTIHNPKGLLKPGMYGVARLRYPLGDRLAVPVSAVLSTGEHNIVFRAGRGGTITPIYVTLGPRSGDDVEVVAGLKPGDRVVTSANFLIDSESSLKAALKAITGK
ncbi:MAG: efflux RND transporter periplasmic adaptor subunit [Desulfobacteraceae bacterium]|nr:efflux RND transporter periplasmic adaptor subunit [Desulfobacteraceae bacterium]